MKILLNLSTSFAGGQITRAESLANNFSKHFKDCFIVVLKEEGMLKNINPNSKRIIHKIPKGNKYFKLIKRAYYENNIVKRLILKYKIDIYITFTNSMPLRRLQIPSIFCVSTLLPFSKEALSYHSMREKIKYFILKKMIIASSKNASLTLALSSHCKYLLMESGLPEDKIFVAYNGVDTFWKKKSQVKGALKMFNVNDNYLLYVSHFYSYKNHLRLIDVYKDLGSETHQKYKLVLVGKVYDKVLYKNILFKIKKYKLEDFVVLIKGVDKKVLRILYQNTSLFIFASLIENCPNILLEAIMSGCPIISSNFDPMPEFGKNSIEYFDPKDNESIKQRISESLGKNFKPLAKQNKKSEHSVNYSWRKFTSIIYKKSNHLIS